MDILAYFHKVGSWDLHAVCLYAYVSVNPSPN
jgi:hypothetical protein